MEYPAMTVTARECRHAYYCGEADSMDLTIVKEVLHVDGKLVPNMLYLKDYPRKVWVTKPEFRQGNDLLLSEDVGRLDEVTTTQRLMNRNIWNYLNMDEKGIPSYQPDRIPKLKQLVDSGYVYGADISPTALIKARYNEMHPEAVSPTQMAVLDVETDVLHGTERIIMASLTFKEHIYTAYTSDYVKGISDVKDKLQVLAQDLIGEDLKARNSTITFEEVSNDAAIVRGLLKHAHEWLPDVISIWNLDFDLPKLLSALSGGGVDPIDVFCDPGVPHKFRRFKYIPGKSIKVMASGKTVSLHPAERWHWVDAPASFQWIDNMCLYKRIRAALANEPSYSLDAIMNKHLKRGKLKFTQADHLSGLPWHVYMQKHHKLEYIIYNIFDCVGMELLDEVTKDVALSLPLLSRNSDYRSFPSTPKRLCDDLYQHLLRNGKVMGSTGSDMVLPGDNKIFSLKNWIITLPSHLINHEDSIPMLEDLPDVVSKCYSQVNDIDVSAAYPTANIILNMDKENTLYELVKIAGLNDSQSRSWVLDVTGGVTNAVSLSTRAYKVPTLYDLTEGFKERKKVLA